LPHPLGFEQLSNYSGWRVMAKKVPATIVTGAGVVGCAVHHERDVREEQHLCGQKKQK